MYITKKAATMGATALAILGASFAAYAAPTTVTPAEAANDGYYYECEGSWHHYENCPAGYDCTYYNHTNSRGGGHHRGGHCR